MKIYYLLIKNPSLDVMFYNDLPSKKKNSRLPIVTVAVERDVKKIGFTVNCPKDNFSREDGRKRAIDRLDELKNEPYSDIGCVNGPDYVPSVSKYVSGLVENIWNFCVKKGIV